VKALRIVTNLVVDSAAIALQLASDPEAIEALLSTLLNASRSFPARAEALAAVHELLQGGHASAAQLLDRIRAHVPESIPDLKLDLFACPVEAIELLDRLKAHGDSESAQPTSGA
jgi:two-component sensor histidine kinase